MILSFLIKNASVIAARDARRMYTPSRNSLSGTRKPNPAQRPETLSYDLDCIFNA